MGELQTLGAVHGHEANRVLALACFHRDHAPGLAEVSEIVDQFFQFGRLVELFLFPFVYEVQGGLKNGRLGIECKLLDDDVERRASLRLPATDFFAGALNGGENIRTSVDPVECGGKRDDLGFSIVPGYGPHDLAKLFGIYVKSWQGGYAKQADVVAGGDDRVQAGKQVASFRSIGDVHALDDERNVGFGQFLHDFVAVEVRAVENAEVGPFAFRFFLRIPDGTD